MPPAETCYEQFHLGSDTFLRYQEFYGKKFDVREWTSAGSRRYPSKNGIALSMEQALRLLWIEDKVLDTLNNTSEPISEHIGANSYIDVNQNGSEIYRMNYCSNLGKSLKSHVRIELSNGQTRNILAYLNYCRDHVDDFSNYESCMESHNNQISYLTCANCMPEEHRQNSELYL